MNIERQIVTEVLAVVGVRSNNEDRESATINVAAILAFQSAAISSLLWDAYSELSAIRHGRPMSEAHEVDRLLGRLEKAAKASGGQ